MYKQFSITYGKRSDMVSKYLDRVLSLPRITLIETHSKYFDKPALSKGICIFILSLLDATVPCETLPNKPSVNDLNLQFTSVYIRFN